MFDFLDLFDKNSSATDLKLYLGVLAFLFFILRTKSFFNKYSFPSTYNPKWISDKSTKTYGTSTNTETDPFKNSINTNKFSDKVVFFFRRNRALKKCKKFTTKTKKFIKIKNQYLNITYLLDRKIITCKEVNKEKRILTVNWIESAESEFEYKSKNNIFEKMFDNICLAFNEKTTYDNVAPILKNYFKTKEEITNAGPKKAFEEIKEPKKIENKQIKNTIVDINKASEEELTKLAGITLIKAKQIIKYRDLHKGFKSKEEFFEQMKIKNHFKMQQYEYIVLSEYIIEESEIPEERILDF